jgi:sorting nexin-8
MSLFGDDPDQPAPSISKSKGLSSSLFDDEPSAASKSTSSLFADEDTTSGGSPWGIPTPKKSGRGNLIKSLLPASAVPESYIDAFDTLLASDGEGAGISETGVMKVLESSGITTGEQLSIQKVVSTGGAVLGRNEFNVLVALIGLAQEGEDANLDGVDDRRKSACFD